MKHYVVLILLTVSSIACGQTTLKYVPAAPDNPLKGLVPYAGSYVDRFPHSMEFNYLPLSALVNGPKSFDWEPLENLLDDIAGRRHQAVFRIWMEYPGRNDGIPSYLEKQGLKVTEWLNTNTDPFPRQKVRTPDYSDPRLRKLLKDFVAAMGAKYDDDPRIGYITAGLLGTWGEWHTYPREELMADKEVQTEIMDAYEAAFSRTPILLRYPAGDSAWAHAPNHRRRFGYHDDSFAWATLDTGRTEDNWFFVPALKAAGHQAVSKWKTSPIGGEIRPEVWGQIFDDRPKHKQAQNFSECVRQTHATWLMDTGMFERRQSSNRIRNAVRQVQQMGYEFHIESCQIDRHASGADVKIVVKNTGVAPFYHNWKTELAAVTNGGAVIRRFPVDWSVAGLLPEDGHRVWSAELKKRELPKTPYKLAVRIVNPLPKGLPLRFANEPGRQTDNGWLRLP